MDAKTAISISDYTALSDADLRAAFVALKEERNTILRIKHWRAILTLKQNLAVINKALGKIKRLAKNRKIDLEPKPTAKPESAEEFQIGSILYSPHYKIEGELVQREYSPNVGTIFILRGSNGAKYPTSREDLHRGRI